MKIDFFGWFDELEEALGEANKAIGEKAIALTAGIDIQKHGFYIMVSEHN